MTRLTGRRAAALLIAATLLLMPAARPVSAARNVVVGSKAFAESWILADALAQTMQREGVPGVEHRRNLGGTEIVFQALRTGSVDVYPEYTGTIREVVLQSPRPLSTAETRAALAPMGLGMSDPIGFNDSYAIAVTGETARRYGLRTLSDLARHPELRLGLTHEFLGRADGFPGLQRRYGLTTRNVLGIQHELAYAALADGKIDATDIYTTDAQIARMGLRVLEDDREFFPRYDAVWIYRLDLPLKEPRAYSAIRRLTGAIDQDRMTRANARVVLGGLRSAEAAESLLAETPLAGAAAAAGGAGAAPAHASPAWSRAARSILANTAQHVKLVALSLLAAILVGVPLGVFATRSPRIGGAVLALTGLAQTVPSLALLAVLIPVFGIGVVPALIALFVYSLLPIVRNTYVGMTTIAPPLLESADCLPLSPRSKLTRIRLPLASPSILAGIRTSAVINVGSATLAALIGAGGLGEPILTGIQLRRNGLILEGAIPAAVLALLVERAFDGVDRILIPKGLRLAASGGANEPRTGLDSSRIKGGTNPEEDHDADAPSDRNA
ncbi:MAG TPA: glycine betaine ABC transporter substrate-binding protein [Candidatus Limnocylindrales bacterium]|nr:glycine betaine ABC transporter substrate-binding protein [Candidatus Limnocylindrales bacterium]